jgi:hypothetical protein
VRHPTPLARAGVACMAALAIGATGAQAHTAARTATPQHHHAAPIPRDVVHRLSRQARRLHAHDHSRSAYALFLRLCRDWRQHHHSDGSVDQPLPRSVLRRLGAQARRIHRAHPTRAAYPIFLRLARDWRRAHARPAPDAVIPAISTAARRYGFSPAGMIRVARCESGLDRSATNGQYLGLFQLGGSARERYLDGDWHDAWLNATAAARYARAAGGFGPWTCGYAY